MWPSLTLYFSIVSVAWLLAGLMAQREAQKRGLSPTRAFDLVLVGTIGGFVGARAAFVFWVRPEYFWEFPVQALWFWQGGLVFLGGIIGGLLSGWAFLWIKKESPWPWLDVTGVSLPLGYGLGRLACFFSGCCHGKSCSLPWGLVFPSVDEIARHPTQLYALGWELLLLVGLLKAKSFLRGQGQLFALWAFGHGLGRLWQEFLRGDDRGPHLVGPLSFSATLSIVLMAVGALVFWLRRPGNR